MFVVRPVVERDLPGLLLLARTIEGGLTSVPTEERGLQEHIERSVTAFGRPVRRPGFEYYQFVAEDLASGELVGTSAIAARVGGSDPFYSFELREECFVHEPWGVNKTMTVLCLKQIHDGPSELGGLCVHPDRRGRGLGRLLSLARFLFMAAFPERFTTSVAAELRGYIDQQGRSLFWEAVGRTFFDHDFYTVDAMSGGAKQFIADLMPRHPIYVALLPRVVQSVIGRVHRDSEHALELLKSEGFSTTNEVDIFDAGPLVRAELAQIRSVRECRRATLSDVSSGVAGGAGPELLVANPSLSFRCTLGTVQDQPSGTVAVAPSIAEALQVRTGDIVSFVSTGPALEGTS